jgi:hypothetical protein
MRRIARWILFAAAVIATFVAVAVVIHGVGLWLAIPCNERVIADKEEATGLAKRYVFEREKGAGGFSVKHTQYVPGDTAGPPWAETPDGYEIVLEYEAPSSSRVRNRSKLLVSLCGEVFELKE